MDEEWEEAGLQGGLAAVILRLNMKKKNMKTVNAASLSERMGGGERVYPAMHTTGNSCFNKTCG